MHLIKNSQSGFTLVEVMVAVMVLVTGLVAAATMQTRSVQQNMDSDRMSDRVTAGEQWMEDLMARPIIPEGDIVPDDFFPTDPLDTYTETSDNFTVSTDTHTITCRATIHNPITNMMKFDVSVVPRGGPDESVLESRAQWLARKTITFSYIRSTRWN